MPDGDCQLQSEFNGCEPVQLLGREQAGYITCLAEAEKALLWHALKMCRDAIILTGFLVMPERRMGD